ncbi:hypothetical protein ILUMI_04347 [Ignelater luminosus]|uniref:DDE-1 domain-containing protein n=1 Tax=Ignelater luminosus TaxID=2038154 RepID=A0A8K0DEI1_IGNLU|nr:hypothetical protein ILUMI_04347 [Ignelater luminosus]
MPTLERHVKEQRKDPALQVTKTLRRYKCVFSEDQQNKLVNYLINMEQHLLGLTSKEVRPLAFPLASVNGQNHPFNKEERLAGRDWYFGFQKRSSTKHDLNAEKIFIVDKSGITVNPKIHSRIGNKLLYQRYAIRKWLQQEFQQGLPPGTRTEVHETDWITKESFAAEFVVFSKATNESPVLELLDGHSTRTKNLDLIDYANDHEISLLCFPPHCSHRFQPLGVSFIKFLSKCFLEQFTEPCSQSFMVLRKQECDLYIEMYFKSTSDILPTRKRTSENTEDLPQEPSASTQTHRDIYLRVFAHGSNSDCNFLRQT